MKVNFIVGSVSYATNAPSISVHDFQLEILVSLHPISCEGQLHIHRRPLVAYSLGMCILGHWLRGQMVLLYHRDQSWALHLSFTTSLVVLCMNIFAFVVS